MEEIDLISSNNSPFIMDEIRDVLNKIEDTEKSEQDFVRKSTSKKIEDNNLTVIKMDIEDFLTDEWCFNVDTLTYPAIILPIKILLLIAKKKVRRWINYPSPAPLLITVTHF